MQTIKIPIEATKNLVLCDCGCGKWESTGIVFLTFPARYEYKCQNCGNIKQFLEDEAPGYISFEEIEE